ncbi:MAG: tyrosine-type recombinase/integrase [Kiritimatiellae bacterium]|nr:tyrosine-type recombinase/integrase [Kiritimatiellia bacterium]
MDIRTALAKFQVQLEADGRSRHTVAQYDRHVRLFAHWLRTGHHSGALDTIDHEIVAGFLASPQARTRPDGRIKKASAMNALRSSIKGFFAYLHRAGLVRLDAGRLIRRAACGTPPPRALTVEQERQLLAALATANSPEEQRDAVLFTVMLRTGVRLSSALNLDVADVDLGRAELRLRSSKGNREVMVYANETTRTSLKRYLGSRTEGPVFLARHGGRPSPRHIARRFGMWLARAGIERQFSPHSMRHAFACRLYERSGGDILLLQRALTHRSIASTAIYAQVPDRRLRQALEG